MWIPFGNLLLAFLGLVALGPLIITVCLLLFWRPSEKKPPREPQGFPVIMPDDSEPSSFED